MIGGFGAFVAIAEDRAGFAAAILNKLVREIAGDPGSRRQSVTAIKGIGATIQEISEISTTIATTRAA